MPPPAGPFSDPANEVVCPLKNNDGSSCRKKCTGEKKYRSMQEHIRRAHPEHYIPKLPATEESFALMVNSAPHERPPPATTHPLPAVSVPAGPVAAPAEYTPIYSNEYTFPPLTRTSGEFRRAPAHSTANSSDPLSQLLHGRAELPWEQDHGYGNDMHEDGMSLHHRAGQLDPPTDPALLMNERYPDPSRTRDLLPSSMARSPPYYRSNAIPPGRVVRPNRPRKSSIAQNSRKPKHERTKSRDHQRRASSDRKAMSAEPSSLTGYGKRWEDLIDAAASATEEDSRELTPIPSPRPHSRASLPPLVAPHMHHNHAYTASPLQRALTPPPPDNDIPPFASVDSSVNSSKSGQNFHIPSQGLSDSSPLYPHPVQIYCAGCHRLAVLKDSYACTECICGLCKDCVDAICSEQSRRRLAGCPKCAAIGGKFKPFQLDIR